MLLKQTIVFTIIIGVTLAAPAPWVILDSRNDMLAMSSEVSESVVATTGRPVDLEGMTSLPDDIFNDDTKITEEKTEGTTTEPELMEKDLPSATEGKMDDVEVDEVKVVAEQIKSDDSAVQTTTAPDSPVQENDVEPNHMEEVMTFVVSESETRRQSSVGKNSMEEDVIPLKKKLHMKPLGKKNYLVKGYIM